MASIDGIYKYARVFALSLCIAFAGAALFFTDSSRNARSQTPETDAQHPANVAALVNGHVISLDEVTTLVMRENGSNATTRLIENYLVDEDARAKKVAVSRAEIDGRLQELSKLIAPMTLEDGLRMHHQSLDDLENDVRQWLLRVKLVSPQVAPGTFVRARIILIKSGNSGSDEKALGLIREIQDKLKAGKKFEGLAKQYNEDPSTKEKSGDTGVLFAGAPCESSLIDAAILLKPGEVTQSPVKSQLGYYLIQVTSTATKHATEENQMYAEAEKQYTRQQAQALIPEYIKELRGKSDIRDYLPE